MTSSEENVNHTIEQKSPLSWIVTGRRKLRFRVNENESFDKALHLYSSIILLLNIILILFAMISITSRMFQNGVPLIDSIPLAFYILPLLIFLPKLLIDYYRSRSAFLTIVILLIVALVFGMISTLVRGFIILVVLNVASIVIIFILGRFRPTVPIRSIGRKGVAWFLILNSLGLMLPASIYLMGQYPIATATYSESTTIFLEMPLDSFEYAFVNLTPSGYILSQLEQSGFGVDLRVSTSNIESIQRLTSWVVALTNASIPYRLTISSNREDSPAFDTTLLGNTALIEWHYTHMLTAIDTILTEFDNLEISSDNLSIYFDMRLSDYEWSHLLNLTRSIDLQGFSQLVRRSLDSIASSYFPIAASYITQALEGRIIDLNLVVEGFVIDDMLDDDITMMEFCGVSPEVLSILDADIEVGCERSRYSEAMDGDVGGYLVHTYSVSPLVNSVRIGVAGTETGLEPIPTPVYQSLEELAGDIVRASGNGVQEIVVSSLPSILHSFGSNGITDLNDAIESQEVVTITYTFRIFAFRAVVMAIDSFDFLMY